MATDATVTLWTLFAVCLVFLAMRAGSRAKALGGAGHGVDDLVLFASCLPMIGMTLTAELGTGLERGSNIRDLSLAQIEYCLMLIYISQILYIAVVYGSKISFVLLFLRIWRDPMRFRRVCQGVVAILTLSLVAFEFAVIFQCTPVSYNWTFVTGAHGSCVDWKAIMYTNSGWNIALDLCVLLLPVPPILKLQMRWPKKAMLLSVFSVGIAVTACSIVRLKHLVPLGASTNAMENYTHIGLWSLVEVYLSIICCCVPLAAGLLYRTWNQGRWAVSIRRVEEADRRTGGSHTGSNTSPYEGEKSVKRMEAQVRGFSRPPIRQTDDLESGKLFEAASNTSPSGHSDSTNAHEADTTSAPQTPGSAQSSDDEYTITSETVYGLAEDKLKRTHDSFIGGGRTSTDAYSTRSWDRPLSQEGETQHAEIAIMFSPRHIRRPTDESNRPPSRGRSIRERSLPASRAGSDHGGVSLPTRSESAVLQGADSASSRPVPWNDRQALETPDSGMSRSTQNRAAIAEAMPPLTIGAPPPPSPPPLDIGEPLATPPKEWPPMGDSSLDHETPSSSGDTPSPSWSQRERKCQRKAGDTAEALAATAMEIGTDLAGTEMADGMSLMPCAGEDARKADNNEHDSAWLRKERRCQQKAGETADVLATTAFEMGTELQEEEDPHATGTQLTTPTDWAPVVPTPQTPPAPAPSAPIPEPPTHDNPLRSQGRSSLFSPTTKEEQTIIQPTPLPGTSSKRSSPTIPTTVLVAPPMIRHRSSSETSLARKRTSSAAAAAHHRSSASSSTSPASTASLARQRSSADLSSSASLSRNYVRKGSSPTILDDLVMRARARREREREEEKEEREREKNRAWGGGEWVEIENWREIDTL